MKVIMQVQLRNQYITNQSNIKKNMICKQRNTLTKGEGQYSRHHNIESLIMEAKYFCILAYKHETDYNRSISQTKRYGHQWSHLQESISTWSSRGGLAVNLLSCTGSFLSSCQPFQNGYMLVYIGKRTFPSLPYWLNPKTQ